MTSGLAVTNVVDVEIIVKDASTQSGDFGLACFMGTSNVIPLNERVRAYTDSTSILSDFGAASQEFIAGNTWFSQQPSPPQLLIGRWVNADQSGQVQTDTVTQGIGAIELITDGSFNISIDGDAQDILSNDFTGVTDLDDIAAVLQTNIQAIGTGGFTAATVQSVNGGFLITSGTTGATSLVTLPIPVVPPTGTDLTVITALNLGSGTEFTGADQETAVEAIQAVQAVNDSWYGMLFTNVIRAVVAEVINVATYLESIVKVFGTTSNDPNTITTATTDLASQLQILGFNRTQVVYHDDAQYYPEVSIMSESFTVNWLGTNTTLVQAFKSLPGIPFVDMTQTEYNNLLGKNANAYVKIGGVDQFQTGTLASGRFFDIQHGVDWLQDYITVNVLAVLVNTPKVPYTDAGAALLETAVRDSLAQSVTNGFASSLLGTDGKEIPAYTVTVPLVSTVPEAQKIARIAPTITFTLQASGAIQKAVVNGTVII